MRKTPPTIRPVKHRSPASDCAWVDHVRWQPQTLYSSTQLQDGLDTDLNVYTIGTVWNMPDWQQKSYTVSGVGTHSLMWQYVKDGSVSEGSDRGWVDYLQWTPGAGGASTGVACPELADWDDDQAIGGPRPTLHHANRQSSTRNHQSEAVYEYDVYGQVAASDPNHTNPFLFTGREFDKETGLYYYRARYYNPAIGRFLQTDPIGYENSVNLYRYCRNNPVRWVDPLGTHAGAGLDWGRASAEPNLGSWHRDRNLYNQAYATVEEMRRAAIDHPEWWEKETGNPFHWPDTYRGKGPYAGCQASYFPQPDDPILEDPDFARWYDPNKAGMLDDETPMMGTWDYCPPSESTWGHFWQDVLTHAYDSHYTPGLTTSIEYPAHEYCPYGVTAGQECPVCGLCACYCYYPWTWGYCTVLHKWADGALGLA